MKKSTYRILRRIPVCGAFVESITMPYQLTGSMERESGLADEIGNLVNEYLQKHPDEQVTRQLVDKIIRNHK